VARDNPGRSARRPRGGATHPSRNAGKKIEGHEGGDTPPCTPAAEAVGAVLRARWSRIYTEGSRGTRRQTPVAGGDFTAPVSEVIRHVTAPAIEGFFERETGRSVVRMMGGRRGPGARKLTWTEPSEC
jgi:hypothetical protein